MRKRGQQLNTEGITRHSGQLQGNFFFVTDNSIKFRYNLGSFKFYGSKDSFWIFKHNSLWRHAVTLATRAVSHHQLSPRNSPKTVYSYPTLKPPSFYRSMAPIHDEVLTCKRNGNDIPAQWNFTLYINYDIWSQNYDQKLVQPALALERISTKW